jgi:hypothetical protein
MKRSEKAKYFGGNSDGATNVMPFLFIQGSGF